MIFNPNLSFLEVIDVRALALSRFPPKLKQVAQPMGV